MDLAYRLIWNLSPELQADKIQQKQFFCQITKCSFEFLSFDNFSFSNFQVLLRRLKKLIFCQIIMGSQLNNNVSKGRSVHKYTMDLKFFPYNFVWQFHPQFMINILLNSLQNNSALFLRMLRCQRISHYDDMITHFLCKRRQGTTHLPSRRIVHTSLTMVHLNASWVMKFEV